VVQQPGARPLRHAAAEPEVLAKSILRRKVGHALSVSAVADYDPGFMCLRTGALVLLGLMAAGNVRAQEPAPPRIEAGADVSSFQVPYWPRDAGAGAHVTIAITPLIAIETRVRLFGPSDFSIPAVERGGRTFEFFSGARATFLSRGRFTAYGLLTPGLIHFSEVVTSLDRDTITIGSATRFAIDMGGGVSIRVHDRWSVHADWTGPLYGVDGFSELSTFPPAAERGIRLVTVPATIQATAQFSAGVSYRAGSIAAPIEPQRRGAWLVGGDFGAAAYAPVVPVSADVTRAARVGGFTSFPLTSWMDADIAADVYLRTDKGHASNEGGRISHALAGVKLGRRTRRVGYFGKIRVGVQSHSQGLLASADFDEPPPYPRPVFGRRYRPAIDVGTVIETPLWRRLVWRVDVSDIIAFYPEKVVMVGTHGVTNPAMPASDQILITSGLAWRF